MTCVCGMWSFFLLISAANGSAFLFCLCIHSFIHSHSPHPLPTSPWYVTHALCPLCACVSARCDASCIGALADAAAVSAHVARTYCCSPSLLSVPMCCVQSATGAASKAFPLADDALTVSILDLVSQANNYKSDTRTDPAPMRTQCATHACSSSDHMVMPRKQGCQHAAECLHRIAAWSALYADIALRSSALFRVAGS